MSDNESHTCCATKWERGSFPRRHPCGNRGKVECDGKWYCGIHDPAAVKRRDDKAQAEWDAKLARTRQEHRIKDAANKCLEWCVSHIDEMPAELRAEIAKAYPDLTEDVV